MDFRSAMEEARRGGARSRQHQVPTGEPETLRGHARSFAVYEPSTKETRAAYEALLSLIQQHLGLGGQAPDATADEVLATLKDDKVTDADKKRRIEKLISPMSNLMFHQLVSVANLITDFRDGVVVEFYDDDEE